MTATDFIHAICADPADDLPRLYYADWLEERGEDDRAEFIRVQVELARSPDRIESICNRCGRTETRKKWSVQSRCMKCKGSTRKTDEENRRDALRRREKELGTLTNFHLWAGSNFPLYGLHGWNWEWRRGFVSSVTCRLEDWIGVPCIPCRGQGWMSARIRGGPERGPRKRYIVEPPVRRKCLTCHGTGRIGAHGIEIVKVQPVTEVRATDTDQLPPDVEKFCWRGCVGSEADFRSAALVAWARDKAGLPKLKEVR